MKTENIAKIAAEVANMSPTGRTEFAKFIAELVKELNDSEAVPEPEPEQKPVQEPKPKQAKPKTKKKGRRPTNASARWTRAEDNIVRDHANRGLSVGRTARELKRTRSAIENRRVILGVTTKAPAPKGNTKRGRPKSDYRKQAEEHASDLNKLFRAGVSVSDLSKAYKIPDGFIRKVLK